MWTNKIFHILDAIGKEWGYDVGCHPFTYEGNKLGNKEYLLLDCVYRPTTESDDGYLWEQPKVVIEHENEERYEAKKEDFYKLCLFAVPLRVFIGYCLSTEKLNLQMSKMIAFYDSSGFQQVSNGETLIMLAMTIDQEIYPTWLISCKREEGNRGWIDIRFDNQPII